MVNALTTVHKIEYQHEHFKYENAANKSTVTAKWFLTHSLQYHQLQLLSLLHWNSLNHLREPAMKLHIDRHTATYLCRSLLHGQEQNEFKACPNILQIQTIKKMKSKP